MPRVAKGATRAPPGLPDRTFVIDNGGYSIKAGFAPAEPESNEDSLARCHVVANAIVRTRDRKTYVAAQMAKEVTQWGEAVFRRPVEHGQLVGWEAQKEIWDYSFFDERSAQPDLHITQPEETSLILTESPNAIPTLQRNADEIVMEEWGFGGYCRTQAATLNAYNDLHPLFEGYDQNTENGMDQLPMECLLVIDSGYSHTTITPLFNGRPLQRAIRRLDFGGKHITNLLKEVISVRHFDLHQDTKIVNDVKEDTCFVSKSFKAHMEDTWKGNKKKPRNPRANPDDMDVYRNDADTETRIDYILPDGIHLLRGFSRPYDASAAAARKKRSAAMSADAEIVMTLGNERFTIPEIIFSPSDVGSKQPGLADCVMQSLAVLPPLIQATLLSNVLIVGGNANIPNFVDRVRDELRTRVKSEWAVHVSKMADPVTSSWLGGARMASRHRDVVREYGVTREEYLEHGGGWVGRRFLSGPS
jgi:actin-related protein 6